MQIEERNELTRSMWRILGVTFVSELVGAAALTASFMRHGEGLAEAAWRGLFTAVSAFCNAGFALQSDSLIPYQRDPAILHVVALLIIVGGLSPVAVMAIPQFLRRRSVDVQVSLILWTSALLLAVGAVLYGLMEWTVSLGHLSFADRLHNTWFQSVTLRTAGFNSVDLAVSRPATQTMMILQMFVGGSPGGTAGGVKTTTAAVLLITVAATLRGHPDATAFRRIISRRTVFKAAAVVTVGALMAFGALTAILLTQLMPPEVALFEVISALATVGLSTGGTGALDSVGKIIIIACMFAGRVGPLTLFVLLAQQQGMHHQPRYPDVEVDVG
jgi:trk system potassium uptake protein TrkH